MKIAILVVSLLMSCTAAKPQVRGEITKSECESKCNVLGYEVREVRKGNCICNLSRCRFVERGCEPLPPPPDSND